MRILPPDDPYLKVDHDLLVPKEEHRSSVFWRKGRSAGFALNVLLVDGEIVGRVARQQANVRIEPWRKLTKRVVEAATAEAEGISRALGRPGRVTWAEP